MKVMKTGRNLASALLLLLCVCSASEGAKLSVKTSDAFPTKGKPTTITVTDSLGAPATGAELNVVYYPGSKVESLDTLGITDQNGTLIWKPTVAGLVTITATLDRTSQTINRSVKFDSVPASGVVIFIVAGTLLLGGAGWSIVRLFEHQPPDDDLT